MINNNVELAATQERIIRLQNILAQLRVTASPDEFPYVAGSYKAEIEKMQAETMQYLSSHATEERQVQVA